MSVQEEEEWRGGDEVQSAQLRVGACVAACWPRKGRMTNMWDVFQSSGLVESTTLSW